MAGRQLRAVISTDEHGNEKYYPSMQAAADDIGLSQSGSISWACSTGRRCAGRRWRYAKEKAYPVKVREGDRVNYRLTNLAEQGREEDRTYPGKVIYVHPAERYHTVEFKLPSGKKIRESFPGVIRRC